LHTSKINKCSHNPLLQSTMLRNFAFYCSFVSISILTTSKNVFVDAKIGEILDKREENDVRSMMESGPFQVKLYWKRGFYWQEEKTETRWCIECQDSCKSGSKAVIQTCRKKDPKQKWVFEDKKFKPSTNKNLCIDHSDRKELRLKTCLAVRDGDQKFEKVTESGGRNIFKAKGKCLTQHHHPRYNEVLRLDKCELAKRSDTIHWEMGGPWEGHE